MNCGHDQKKKGKKNLSTQNYIYAVINEIDHKNTVNRECKNLSYIFQPSNVLTITSIQNYKI